MVDRGSRSDIRRGRDSALVLGGGIAGLLAARVLADHYRTVTVLEADADLGDDSTVRPGVPQAHQIHALLARGGQILEELFPGLRAELAAEGAPILDYGSDVRVLFPHGWSPPHHMGLTIQSVSRTLLESRIRRRVTEDHDVRWRTGVVATGLRAKRNGVPHVVGVTAEDRATRAGLTVDADLVVDATGRKSKLASWLATVGLPPALVTVVDADWGYATRTYRVPRGARVDLTGRLIHPVAPTTPRGGGFTEIDQARCMVTLLGTAGDHPPSDDAGFRAFAASLRDDVLATHVIDRFQPIDRVRVYRDMASRRTDYHRLPSWPAGLIAVGDSVSAFNPIYGQGMTVAALQAVALDDLLARSRPDSATWTKRFQDEVAGIVQPAWELATGGDAQWINARQPLKGRISLWYFNNLLAAITGRPVLYRRFAHVIHMLAPPSTLMRPAVAGGVLAHVISGTRPSAPPERNLARPS